MGGHLYLERSYEVSLTNCTLNLLSPGASPICSLHDFLCARSRFAPRKQLRYSWDLPNVDSSSLARCTTARVSLRVYEILENRKLFIYHARYTFVWKINGIVSFRPT